jgi:hypothetical protein
MDKSSKIKKYERLILAFLNENQLLSSEVEAYQRIVVSDKINHHYQLLANGWATPVRYINTILIHLQIRGNDKVWLLENNTEIRVAEELVRLGIPREDIVLGFQPPQLRVFSDYAVS